MSSVPRQRHFYALNQLHYVTTSTYRRGWGVRAGLIFAAWVFYALAAFAVIVLRRKMPSTPRPYRVWGYPVMPVAFVLAAVWFLVNMLLERPAEAGWGCLILLAGIPVYLIWKRRVACRNCRLSI